MEPKGAQRRPKGPQKSTQRTPKVPKRPPKGSQRRHPGFKNGAQMPIWRPRGAMRYPRLENDAKMAPKRYPKMMYFYVFLVSIFSEYFDDATNTIWLGIYTLRSSKIELSPRRQHDFHKSTFTQKNTNFQNFFQFWVQLWSMFSYF